MRSVVAAVGVALALTGGCGGSSQSTTPQNKAGDPPPAGGPPSGGSPTYDVDARGIPRFVETSQIELGAIARVSTFRSAIGHDYHDDFESCRSMKHYFQPRSDVDWSKLAITSPVDGTVSLTRIEQTFGTQVLIRPTVQPAFTIILFHVNPSVPLDGGTRVTAGERLGTHIGSQTMSDVAVGVDTPSGYKLVSWFDVITDQLFAAYTARGVSTRASAVISRASRDARPLACIGETFVGTDTLLTNWVALSEVGGASR